MMTNAMEMQCCGCLRLASACFVCCPVRHLAETSGPFFGRKGDSNGALLAGTSPAGGTIRSLRQTKRVFTKFPHWPRARRLSHIAACRAVLHAPLITALQRACTANPCLQAQHSNTACLADSGGARHVALRHQSHELG